MTRISPFRISMPAISIAAIIVDAKSSWGSIAGKPGMAVTCMRPTPINEPKELLYA